MARRLTPDDGLGWWRRRSLRARLTAAAALVIAVAITSSAILLTVRLRDSLTAAVDEAAHDRAEAVAAELEAGQLPDVVTVDDDDVLVQVVDQAGGVVAASAGLVGERAVLPSSQAGAGGEVRTVDRVSVTDGAEPFRVLAVPVLTGDERFVVVVGLPLDDVEESVDQLENALALGVPAVIALLAGITWVLVGRALRPVEALRRQAADLSGSALDQRLQVPPSRDELARLAQTFNDLLNRVESATQRQRRFVADAAHEIRSPLAALRAQLEVAQLEVTQLVVTQRHPEQAGWRDVLPTLIDDAARLSRLVDDLLRLARLDARHELISKPLDFDDIVLDGVRRARTQTLVSVDASGVSAARVSGDLDALTRVVQNLLDNATRHARLGVVVTLSSVGSEAVLTVTDDGPGIPIDARERIFDRFTRLDDARTRDAGGAGLGLAIVRDVVEQHGGRVRVEDARPGACLVVHIPTCRS
ncbi:MAG: ATP-binding protein [Actinomycetota bacterium]|nr:HAMP domain-containing protein [Nocardioidaceae bacterium]MDQ3273953.1 ATP-binding protein [Actinomycetota bacterium]